MSVLFVRGLDVPNCLRISSSSQELVLLSLFMLCRIFRKCCDDRFSQMVLQNHLFSSRADHVFYVVNDYGVS